MVCTITARHACSFVEHVCGAGRPLFRGREDEAVTLSEVVRARPIRVVGTPTFRKCARPVALDSRLDLRDVDHAGQRGTGEPAFGGRKLKQRCSSKRTRDISIRLWHSKRSRPTLQRATTPESHAIYRTTHSMVATCCEQRRVKRRVPAKRWPTVMSSSVWPSSAVLTDFVLSQTVVLASSRT